MSVVLSSLLAPALAPLYRGVGERIGRATGLRVEFVEGLEDGFDLAFVCSPRLVSDASLVAVAAPVPAAARYGGAPVYFSDVVVATSSDFGTIDDLREARWGFNERPSYSGFGALVWGAHERWGSVPELIETGSHAASLRRVVERSIDAAAIDSVLLDELIAADAELRDTIRIVGSFGPAPIQPLVARGAEVHGAVVDAVLSMHDDPASAGALAAGSIERFVAVDRADYDVIAARLPVIERA